MIKKIVLSLIVLPALSFASPVLLKDTTKNIKMNYPVLVTLEENTSLYSYASPLGIGGGVEFYAYKSGLKPLLTKYFPGTLQLDKPDFLLGFTINEAKKASMYMAIKSTVFVNNQMGTGVKAFMNYLHNGTFNIHTALYGLYKIPLKLIFDHELWLAYVAFKSESTRVNKKTDFVSIFKKSYSLFEDSSSLVYGVLFQKDIAEAWALSLETDLTSWSLALHLGKTK